MRQYSAPTYAPTSVPTHPWMGLLRPVWRRVLHWRYRLFQAHRHDRLTIEQVAGTPIVVMPQVFNPSLFRSGELLARWTAGVVQRGQTVLDLGTGTGVGAIFAAKRGASVVAIDVNPAAVRCARINCLLNAVEDAVDVRLGDLFGPVPDQRFDVVLFNPPYYRGEPQNPLDQAFRSNGVIERFAAGLPVALAPGGFAILVLSSDADPASVMRLLERHQLRMQVLEQRELINEVLLVWRVYPAAQEDADVAG
jgi:release factor glutamine methyltransferase